MAQIGVQLKQERISCSICLDLLKDPVTVLCGHSYCTRCIEIHWDKEDEKRVYSCPQCRKTFKPRPVLGINIMLADLVEEVKKTKVAQLKKLELVDPSKKLQENVCFLHDEVMTMFCRTEQQSFCHLCSVGQHKGHDTVSAAAERTEMQKELEGSRLHVQQRIQDREEDVTLLQRELEAINVCADKAVEHSEKMFTQLIRLVEKRRSDVRQRVRSQQETEVRRVKEHQEKLEQEITELKRKDAELEKFSHTQDHNQFLQNYPSLSALSQSTHSSRVNIRPLRYFEDVTAAVSEVREKLQDVMREGWRNIPQRLTEPDVLVSQSKPGPEPTSRDVLVSQSKPGPEPTSRDVLVSQSKPGPEPTSRDEFLKYSCDITLDQSTASRWLFISEGDRRATHMFEHTDFPFSRRNRFTLWPQVLSKEILTGRCYWEVELKGADSSVAVSYKDMNITSWSNKSKFGFNDKSWALDCGKKSYKFRYNKVKTPISAVMTPIVGVYLDHSAGVLSFYSISETMTLLHRVHTTFTQPLHAGLSVGELGYSAEFVQLK